MYIQKVHIENIRAIEKLDMDFTGREAGWHVVIGDNGSGKSSISLLLVDTFLNIFQIYNPIIEIQHESLKTQGKEFGQFKVDIAFNENIIIADNYFQKPKIHLQIPGSDEKIEAKSLKMSIIESENKLIGYRKDKIIKFYNLNNNSIDFQIFQNNFFSCAYGAYRDINGMTLIEKPDAISQAHITAISTSFGLIAAFEWLKDQEFYYLKEEKEFKWFKHIQYIINETALLPFDFKFIKINSKGIPEFEDSKKRIITIHYLSQGFRSTLTLVFDMIFHLILRYGEDKVFENFEDDSKPNTIDLPGVVLIDEVDAHLHPTWQTRIGEWFTKTFPKMQFIVTTHSPIICRGCGETGTIWKLAAPGSGEESREITGVERDRLVFGNVLDAYGTQAFGEDVVRSDKGKEMLAEMEALKIKSIEGESAEAEEKRLNELQSIFSTGKP